MIYLNNGATSWPKPPAVLEAVQACLSGTPASQFRGGSSIMKKDVEVLCREKLGQLLGIRETERIFFTSGATESMNTVLGGLDYGEKGSSILVTQTEHNSVLRDSDGRSPGNSSTTGQPCADREPLFQRDRLCAGYGDDPGICKETWTDPDRGCVAECWLYPC